MSDNTRTRVEALPGGNSPAIKGNTRALSSLESLTTFASILVRQGGEYGIVGEDILAIISEATRGDA